MHKRQIQRLFTRWHGTTTTTSNQQYKPAYRQRGHTRTLFLIFLAGLLFESSLLQILTTIDGSEIALNPPREVQLASLRQKESISASEVASVETDQSVDTGSQSATPTQSSESSEESNRMSLVTPVNAATTQQPLTTPSMVFKSPLRAYTLTQYYSSYHTAIDMASPYGTPIFATTHGVVKNTGYLLPGGGLMVEVDHASGYKSYYAHMNAITAFPGQSVDNATQIGTVGATGWATGAHLHFMIQKNGVLINPLSVMQ